MESWVEWGSAVEECRLPYAYTEVGDANVGKTSERGTPQVHTVFSLEGTEFIARSEHRIYAESEENPEA